MKKSEIRPSTPLRVFDNPKSQIKILLADDHAVVREGLAAIIKKYSPYTIVAEAEDGIEAIEQVSRQQPDLVILDITLPGLNGLEALRQIRDISPEIKILILSVHRNKDFVTTAIRLGASGYLIKDGAVKELVDAIETILEGKHYISPSLSDIVAEAIVSPSQKKDTAELEKLSARERQILSLIAGGGSKSEIAKRLFISPETVKTHRKNIINKLNLHSRDELVKFAREHKLGPLGEGRE